MDLYYVILLFVFILAPLTWKILEYAITKKNFYFKYLIYKSFSLIEPFYLWFILIAIGTSSALILIAIISWFKGRFGVVEFFHLDVANPFLIEFILLIIILLSVTYYIQIIRDKNDYYKFALKYLKKKKDIYLKKHKSFDVISEIQRNYSDSDAPIRTLYWYLNDEIDELEARKERFNNIKMDVKLIDNKLEYFEKKRKDYLHSRLFKLFCKNESLDFMEKAINDLIAEIHHTLFLAKDRNEYEEAIFETIKYDYNQSKYILK